MKTRTIPASATLHDRPAVCADGGARLIHAGIRPVQAGGLREFLGERGLVLLFLLGDGAALRESADLAAVAPEIAGLFGQTPVTAGFTPPGEGTDAAGRIGVLRLPAVALFLDGRLLGTVEGFREWAGYQEALSGILLGRGAGRAGTETARRRIRIEDGKERQDASCRSG